MARVLGVAVGHVQRLSNERAECSISALGVKGLRGDALLWIPFVESEDGTPLLLPPKGTKVARSPGGALVEGRKVFADVAVLQDCDVDRLAEISGLVKRASEMHALGASEERIRSSIGRRIDLWDEESEEAGYSDVSIDIETDVLIPAGVIEPPEEEGEEEAKPPTKLRKGKGKGKAKSEPEPKSETEAAAAEVEEEDKGDDILGVG